MSGIFLVILASFLWAIDTLIRYPLVQEGIPARAIVFYVHLGLVIVFIVPILKNWRRVWGSSLAAFVYFFIIGGLGSAIATVSFTESFAFLNPSLVILLQKFQPLVAIILAALVLKEPIRKPFIGWAFVALVGALLISYQDLSVLWKSKKLSDLLFARGAPYGYLLVAISVSGWGAATVFGKKLTHMGYSEKEIMAGRFFFGFMCMLPLMTSSQLPIIYPVGIYVRISLLVLFSGLLAMYFYYKGLKLISARACTLAEMFFPFSAVMVNWIFLGATLSAIQLVGGGLLLLASLVIQLKHY